MADLSFEEVSTGFVAVKFAVADALGNHIAYTDSGNVHSTEPVVIFIPGVGDIRAQYRFFAPRFEKSHRVITTDLRGVGDSDVGFDSYTAKDVGEDIMRIILQEDITPEQGVILVGSSIGAVAAQWVAAEFASQDTSLSDIIKGIILIAPTLRNSSSQVVSRMLLRTLLRGNWGINVWQRYHKSLYVTNKPTELDEYVRDLTANLGQGNRLSVVRQFLRSEKSGCGSRLSEVSAPVLLIFGEKDPSLRSPKHEAKWLKRQFTRALSITTELIEGSGHYPHVEFPDKIYSISKSFIANLDSSWKKSGKSHI